MMKLFSKAKIALSAIALCVMLVFAYVPKITYASETSINEGTVYEYQSGSMYVYQNAYEGSIFAEFDAININANKEARLYALLPTAYVYANGGIVAEDISATVTSTDYLVIDLHNLIAAEKSDLIVKVNGTAMSTATYYLENQFGDITSTEAAMITLPSYKNTLVTIAGGTVQGFFGKVIIPMNTFGAITQITSVTVSAKLTQTNLNIGNIYTAASFNITDGLGLTASIWQPAADNYSVYSEALDKVDNTYTINDILTTRYITAGTFIFTGAYSQSKITPEASTADRNYFFWTFPEEMIAEDGMVHLKDLGIKGLIFDYEAETSFQLAIRLGAGTNSALGYSDVVYQTSNSKANQMRILDTGLVKTGNTSYMPSSFVGSVYIPFVMASFTGTGWTTDPDIVYPVIYLDYNNNSLLNEEIQASISNIRFITDDTAYENNLITMVSANGLLEGTIGETAIGSDSNNKVLSGTVANFSIIPNNGYEVSSVTYKFEEEETSRTVTVDENGEFSIVITDSISVFAEYQLINYNVNYVLDGGTNSAENPATFTYLQGFELAEPTRENATFLGWYTTSDFTGNAVTEIEDGTTANITLYASWDVEEEEAPIDENKKGCSSATSAIIGIIVLGAIMFIKRR